MQRVSVVGISGSGKTTVAGRRASLLRCAHIELDSLYAQVAWRPLDDGRFRSIIDERTQAERWVVDGSYRDVVSEGVVWQRADTVVWLRLPKIATLAQLSARCMRGVLGRGRSGNGARGGPTTDPFSLDAERANIADVWARYEDYDRQLAQYRDDPRFAHIEFVVLSSRTDVEQWLAGVDHIPTRAE